MIRCWKPAWLLVLVVISGVAAPAAGRTWRVEKDGTGDFSVIYEALDDAGAGDTIQIGPGRFEECRLEPDYVSETYCCAHITTTGLTLIGGGADVTTIGVTAAEYRGTPSVLGDFVGEVGKAATRAVSFNV